MVKYLKMVTYFVIQMLSHFRRTDPEVMKKAKEDAEKKLTPQGLAAKHFDPSKPENSIRNTKVIILLYTLFVRILKWTMFSTANGKFVTSTKAERQQLSTKGKLR